MAPLNCVVCSLWVGLDQWLIKVSWLGNLCLCSGGGRWISSLWSAIKCPVHSSTLAWKIPWTEEPGGLQCKGLLRVGYD